MHAGLTSKTQALSIQLETSNLMDLQYHIMRVQITLIE